MTHCVTYRSDGKPQVILEYINHERPFLTPHYCRISDLTRDASVPNANDWCHPLPENQVINTKVQDRKPA